MFRNFFTAGFFALCAMFGFAPFAFAQTAAATVLPVSVTNAAWVSLGAGPLALYIITGGVQVTVRPTNCTAINDKTEPLAILRAATPIGGGIPFFSTNIVCVRGMPFATVTFGKGS